MKQRRRTRRAGTSSLARVLDRHVKRVSRPDFPWIDLGTITAAGGLILESFPSIEFPAEDYIVSEKFTGGLTGSRGGGAGEASFAAHDHDQASPLVAGDRVAVIILDAQDNSPTPVVIERI